MMKKKKMMMNNSPLIHFDSNGKITMKNCPSDIPMIDWIAFLYDVKHSVEDMLNNQIHWLKYQIKELDHHHTVLTNMIQHNLVNYEDISEVYLRIGELHERCCQLKEEVLSRMFIKRHLHF